MIFRVVFLAAIVSAAVRAHANPPSEDYILHWRAEFNDPSAYASNWSFRARGWRKEGYLNSLDTVLVKFDPGYLIIRTVFDEPNRAGMVSTQGKALFSHGYFEAEITLPRKIGNHIGFWLKSGKYDDEGPPDSHGAEVDIMEYLPRTPTSIYFNVHAYGYGAQHRFVGKEVADVVCAGCTHLFGLEWTPEQYRFYVDGKPRWSTTSYLSGVPLYLILSSHTSSWAGKPRIVPDVDEVKFHYVRYYKIQ